MKDNNYYSDSYGSGKRRQSILRVVVRLLFAVVSIVAWVALALTLLAPMINPSVWWVFPVLGLFAPAIYLANVITAMVWLLRWRWRFSLSIIVLLILGSGNISKFMKMDISNHYVEQNYRRMIKITSYNLRALINDNKNWSSKEVAQYLDSTKPDIICLQELRAKPLEREFSKRLKGYNKAISADLGIYTKYPIVAKSEVMEQKDGNQSSSMWVDLKIGNDTIRVFNNHLVSTMIKDSDDRYITSKEFIADSLREIKFRDMFSRFKNRSVLRAQHADSIAKIIADSPHRVVVCGDFNDTPMSYTYRSISEGLKDSFQECGMGLPYTFRGFMNTLRIDYILASEGVTFKSYTIDYDTTLSDHLPVTTHFILTKNN